jgi:transposase
MQTIHLLKKRHKIHGIDGNDYSKKAYEREKKIKLFDQLIAEGVKQSTAFAALGASRSSIYRWKKRYKNGLSGLEDSNRAPESVRTACWSQALENHVLALRRINILYGKYKVHAILKRDYGITASVSTIGRIISKLIKQNKIKPASFYFANKIVRPRKFNKHSQRWKVGMKAKSPGELVQFDHMSVRLCANYKVKHFQAVDPITKMVVTQAYVRATSAIASDFLAYAQSQLPFPIKSIQVDGGSEFMKDFEQACERSGIPLFVIPPKSPEYNGVVERTNGSSKYEFYASYLGPLNLVAIRSKLRKYVHKFNTYRPHQALQYKTPMQYYQNYGGQQSHMY